MAEKFAPLMTGHPLISDICPACKKTFKIGDITTLITLGPGDNTEAREKAKAGKAYKATAQPIHWDCCAEEHKTY